MPSTSPRYDAIVIGAGHNGLTAAAYLGKAGLRTLVLERRPVVGGAAVTEEFHPGYRNSIASYVLSLLRPEIIRDLELKRHGLTLIPFRGGLDILSDGRTLLFTGDEMHDRAEVARFSNRDYDAMGALRERLQRVGEILRDQLLREPPDVGGGLDAVLPILRLGGGLRRLSTDDRHFLMQMFTLSANDLMERWFESEAMRQVYAVHCVSSNFSSLDAPGSAIPFFINVLGEFEGKRGRWGLAKGGMGAVTAYGTTPDQLRTALDGCGVETYAFRLREVAQAYALLADPAAVPASDPRSELAPALTIVRDAMLAHPEMVGGRHDRLDTSLMKAVPDRIISKAGMEALRAIAILPEARGGARASGLAIKIEDGDGYDRGTWAASIEAVRQTGVLDASALRVLARYHRPVVLDPHGRVGAEAIASFDLAPVGELIG